MKLFDWFRGRGSEGRPIPDAGLSRRDFFARVAGQAAAAIPEPILDPEAPDTAPAPPKESGASEERLHTFPIAAFPFHDGPVLVPTLRAGMEFTLAPDRDHFTDPTAVRINWRRDQLGYVPAEHSADVRARLDSGERLICRAIKVDPTAELSRVVVVEIVRVVEETENDGVEEADPLTPRHSPDSLRHPGDSRDPAS